jgi:hypothetical protein
MTHPRWLLTALLIAYGAATAPPATATIRYAKPAGMTSGSCTTKGTACRLDRAVSDPVNTDGDTVIVLPGTHDLTNAPASMEDRLIVEGEAGSPRPLIVDNNDGIPFTVHYTATDSRLRHLSFRSLGGSYPSVALQVDAQAVVEDVGIEASRQCVMASATGSQSYVDVTARLLVGSDEICLDLSAVDHATLLRSAVSAPGSPTSPGTLVAMGGGASVEDTHLTAGGLELALLVQDDSSVLRSVITGASGVVAWGGVVISDSILRSIAERGQAVQSRLVTGDGLRLRNVTAIATGDASYGVLSEAGHGSAEPGSIQARNVIARGTLGDVGSRGPGEECGAQCVAAALDIGYSNFRAVAGDGQRTLGPGNQSSDPRFVAADDFRLADDSPAIDAGTADLLGPSALDGSPRIQGAAVDIGAYERAAPPPPPPPPGGDPPQPPAPGPSRDVVRPFLSSVHATRRGTRISLTFVSSEAGSLRGTLSRVLRGRRRRGVCVTRRPRPKRGPLCEKRIVLRRFDENVVAGRNVLSLPVGRLRRGRYQLRIAVHDRAGNVSMVKALRFGVRKGVR